MTPGLIIDCSIAMAWCFADEATAETARVQDRLIAEAALVPAHWFLEVVNVLATAEKRERITAADSSDFLRLLATLDIQTDHENVRQGLRSLAAVVPQSRVDELRRGVPGSCAAAAAAVGFVR